MQACSPMEKAFPAMPGGKCAVCRAPVRDLGRVSSYDSLGIERNFERLCRRCLEAEKAYSRTVFVFWQDIVCEIYTNLQPFPRPAAARVA
jgi:hypothetical protein